MKNPIIRRGASVTRCLERAVMLASIAALSVGCAAEPEEDLGVAGEALENANGLDPAALDPVATDPSALDPALLSPRALDPALMDPAALGAIQDPGDAGALSRAFLGYAVGCAFGPGQSFDFTWTDATGTDQPVSDPGLFGLAPGWATGALDSTSQQWVSDCVASRANALGVSVMLSSRGAAPALAATRWERSTYQTREAAWFGNLFTGTPTVYACYDPLSMLPSDMQDRVCAQPPILDITVGSITTAYECGPITVLGPCTELLGLITLGPCASADPVERYFEGCAPPDGSPVIPSITTFLRGSIPW